MDQRRPTLADIARKFGVSKQAVSRALRDMPDIAVKTRREIQDYAREIGYSVNWAARSLATQKTGLIGIGMGSFTNPFFQEVTYALSRSIKLAGFTPVLIDVEAELSALIATDPTPTPEIRVDGLVLLEGWYNAKLTGEQIALLDRALAPTIYRGNLSSELVDQVVVDWYAASRALTSHLIQLGHRKIAVIRGVGGSDLQWDEGFPHKLRGMIDEMQANGLDHDPDLVMRISTDLSHARQAALKLVARQDRPTAIICHTDYLAIGAIRAISESGLSIPHDISVAGFNDIELGRFLPISLTTIRHDREQVADELVGRLVLRIAKGRMAESHVTQVGHQLVIRESTGPRP